MNFRTNRFLFLALGTLILPVIIYAIYAISSLKENEKVIEQIYKEQLDAIIFSINQYSTDVINSLIDDIDLEFRNEDGKLNSISALEFTGIKGLYIKTLDVDTANYQVLYEKNKNEIGLSRLDSLDQDNKAIIDKLVSYLSADYRKIEPIPIEFLNLDQLFYAVITSKEGNHFLLVGLIDPVQYIREVLNPKLQQISNEELIVVFCESKNDSIIFFTDTVKNDVSPYEKMWLFSQIKVGISSKTTTVSDLVKARVQSNLIASALLIALLLIGLSLIIRNLNREMKLAQNKSDFVSNVSHELRTPLALITMFAETLSLGRAKNEEKKKEYIDIIHKESLRLSNIVNRILNFSKIEANKRTYQLDTFDVAQLVRELMTDYSYHLDQNGFHYTTEIPERSIELKGDREAVYEALVNLLDNAMKFSPEKKEIKLALTEDEASISICVTDLGLGIPKEKRTAIFDKFYRVTEGDVYTVKGTGLGLSIVSHIMDAHHGKIDVISEPGKGSSFILRFFKSKSDD